MEEKRKSYRERYFEDYEARRVPASNRKGWRTEYAYIGRFARWERESGTLKSLKLFFAVLEVLSIGLYVAGALSGSALTKSRFFNGFGVLSLVPWILELYGVVRFQLAGEYVKELDAEEIGRAIRSGSALRTLLVLLSTLSGGIGALTGHTASWADLPALLALLASAGLSALVKIRFDRLLLIFYKNKDGRPGERE